MVMVMFIHTVAHRDTHMATSIIAVIALICHMDAVASAVLDISVIDHVMPCKNVSQMVDVSVTCVATCSVHVAIR